MKDMWGHGHWGNMLVKVLVAVFIFWCGVQFGQLKSFVRQGNYMDRDGDEFRSGPGMMYYYGQ